MKKTVWMLIVSVMFSIGVWATGEDVYAKNAPVLYASITTAETIDPDITLVLYSSNMEKISQVQLDWKQYLIADNNNFSGYRFSFPLKDKLKEGDRYILEFVGASRDVAGLSYADNDALVGKKDGFRSWVSKLPVGAPVNGGIIYAGERILLEPFQRAVYNDDNSSSKVLLGSHPSYPLNLSVVPQKGLFGFRYMDHSTDEPFSNQVVDITSGKTTVTRTTDHRGYVFFKHDELPGTALRFEVDGYVSSSFDPLTLSYIPSGALHNEVNLFAPGETTPYTRRTVGFFKTETAFTPNTRILVYPSNAVLETSKGRQDLDSYTINGNNYYKLRDLALLVSGSEKQFEVGWDQETNSISIQSGKAYTLVGGEFISGAWQQSYATPTAATLYVDGKKTEFTSYNIRGNNYYKLRDVAQALNIGVTWNGRTQTIGLDPTQDYVPEGQ